VPVRVFRRGADFLDIAKHGPGFVSLDFPPEPRVRLIPAPQTSASGRIYRLKRVLAPSFAGYSNTKFRLGEILISFLSRRVSFSAAAVFSWRTQSFPPAQKPTPKIRRFCHRDKRTASLKSLIRRYYKK